MVTSQRIWKRVPIYEEEQYVSCAESDAQNILSALPHVQYRSRIGRRMFRYRGRSMS